MIQLKADCLIFSKTNDGDQVPGSAELGDLGIDG